jgi:uncharacterized protein YjbJ (UPF0337 family)
VAKGTSVVALPCHPDQLTPRDRQFFNPGINLALSSSASISVAQRWDMNEEHTKTGAGNVAGKTKEVAGRVTGNRKLETEGKVDRVKAAVHKTVGDAMDVGQEAIDSVRNAPSRH